MPARRNSGAGGDGELTLRRCAGVDDRARPFLRPLLRQVVAGAFEYAMLVRAGEFLRVIGGAGVYAVRVAVDGDGRNGDRRLSREPHFNFIIPWIAGAGREPVTMAIGMDDDRDEVGIVEGARRSLEGRIVERPVRRPHAPQEAGDASPVLGQAAPATLTVEIVLIPERRLLGRGRGLHRMRDALDIVRIAGDERDGPLGQESGDNASGPPAPIIPAENRALDPERVHEVEKVDAKRRLLARAGRCGAEEPRRSETAQIGNDHPRAGLREDWRGLIIGVHVVRETVAENAWPAGGGSIFKVGDLERAGFDRMHGRRRRAHDAAAGPPSANSCAPSAAARAASHSGRGGRPRISRTGVKERRWTGEAPSRTRAARCSRTG